MALSKLNERVGKHIRRIRRAVLDIDQSELVELLNKKNIEANQSSLSKYERNELRVPADVYEAVKKLSGI